MLLAVAVGDVRTYIYMSICDGIYLALFNISRVRAATLKDTFHKRNN